MTPNHWTRLAAVAIDEAYCEFQDGPFERHTRIARIVAIIDAHRPRDIGQDEVEDALRRLAALEERIDATMRTLEPLKRPMYPHGV